MPAEPIIFDIARRVCTNYLDEGKASRRQDLIVEFEVTHPLGEMLSSALLDANDRRDEFVPTAGTFAILPADEELHQRARKAFLAIAPMLRKCFLRDGPATQYDVHALETEAAKLESPPDAPTLKLGIFLASHLRAVSAVGLSENKLEFSNFFINENIINLKDPDAEWNSRVQSAHRSVSRESVPIDTLTASVYEDLSLYEGAFGGIGEDGIWSLLHPSIVPEAIGRMRSGFYADAVLAALKVITREVRRRTGVDLDGAPLMNKVFSTTQPLLQFDGSGTETARNLQQGYLQIFAGTMMAVRNPKAHGFENIDARRCIHFLFLASLLAYKIDEAMDANQSTP